MSLLLTLRGDGRAPPDPEPRTPIATIAVREPDDRLALSVTSPTSTVERWGGDEIDAQDVPVNLGFSTSMPGGFKDLSCELLRGLNPSSDEGLFRNVRAYGLGNRTAWEGRMAQLPRTNTAVRPGAVGWVTHLEDDKSFREVYVGRDFTAWGPASVQRRINRLAADYSSLDGQVQPDTTTGQPALALECSGAWSATTRPEVSAFYDSRGIPLDALYYAWKRPTNVNNADPNWEWLVGLSSSDLLGGSDLTANLIAAGPGSGILSATTTDRRVAVVIFRHNSSGGADGEQFRIWWTSLGVYGRHGLTKQGSGSATDPPGLADTDIFLDVVRRGAPLLQVTTGPDGSVQADSFTLTHFVVDDPTTASDVLLRLNAYFCWDGPAVWENRELHFAPPTQDTVWVVKTYEGADLGLEGDQAEDMFNGVIVTFTDPIGERKIVGPPGMYADQTNAALLDTDPLNPVNLAGIPRRWARLDLSVVTTFDGAIRMGAIFLAESKLAKRRGDITVVGHQEQQGKAGRFPAWMIRAGHWVTVGDQIGSPLRKIVATSYDHPNRRLAMTLDSTGNKLDAILERLQADLAGVVGPA